MTTIQQIKSIISPVRVLKVKEDWLKVANEKLKKENFLFPSFKENERQALLAITAIQLISRYESLTSQPLTKEMFVCAVERPKGWRAAEAIGVEYGNHEKAVTAYQAAQKKLWFEGFEKIEANSIGICLTVNEFQLIIYTVDGRLTISSKNSGRTIIINHPTVSDLIYHISKFNETASKPVEINVTDSFIQELIK